MFKKMMVLCLVVMCMISSIDAITVKAEQICGAEEYQKIMSKTAELYGESGIMEYNIDSIISRTGKKKVRVLVNFKYNFRKGIYTGVATHSEGKKITAKFNFTYNVNSDKIKYKELVNKDVMALIFIKDVVYSGIKVGNAVDVINGVVSLLAADDSSIIEKAKDGFNGTVVDSLNTKYKFNINISNGLEKIVFNNIISKEDCVEKIKLIARKIG